MSRILILCFLFINLTAFGQTQQALNFDGTLDHVVVSDNNAIDFGSSTDFTIEAWIKLSTSNPDYAGIVVKATTGAFWTGYQLLLHGNYLAGELMDGTNQTGVGQGLKGSTNLNDGKWHHVAMVATRSSTNVKLYVDGVQEVSISATCLGNNLSNSTNLYIGVERSPALYFNGEMDEVRVWNTARTVAELKNNMRKEISNSSTGLVAYYKFNSASGSTLTDGTSNSLNGTLTNFALSGSTSNWVASGAGFAPTISSISSTSGTVGSSITITGTNFNETASNNVVYFGQTKASTPSSVSTTSMTVTVPTGSTFGPVSVLNATNGLVANSTSFFNTTYSPSKGSFTSSDFASRHEHSPGTSWTMTSAAGDFDSDGKPDLVVSDFNVSTNAVRVFPNNSTTGSISFGSVITLNGYAGTRGLCIADVNGDGKLDIIATGTSSSILCVFKNTSTLGNISFSAKYELTMAAPSYTATVGDIDGDGRMDIAAACGTSVSTFLNTGVPGGDLSFAAKSDFTTGNNSFSVALVDMNLDGYIDIVTSNNGAAANGLSVLRNTTTVIGTASFATKVDFTTPSSNTQYLTVGDVDGDGKIDAIVATDNTDNFSVFRNISSGSTINFDTRLDYTITNGNRTDRLAMGDIDGDGKPDLICSDGTNGVALFKNNSTSGSVSFGSKVTLAGSGGWVWDAGVSDIDGDGKLDILFTADPKVIVYLNSPTFYYSQTSGNPATMGNWNSKANGSGSAPANLTQATAYIIQNGHTMTTTGSLSFGTSGSTLQISSGGAFTANHAVTMASGSTLQLDAGSTYNSNVTQTIGTINMVGGKLNIAAGTTLTLNGAVTSTAGVFSGSATSDLTIGAAVGTLLFDQTTPGSTNMIRSLTIGSGSTASMTIGNALVIAPTGYVAFDASGTKTLTTGGNLTLRSTSAGTAAIRNTNSAIITGNVTVERYVPNTRRAYRFLASPVTTSDIWSNWQESGNSTSGYGVYITGVAGVSPGGNDNTTGLDKTVHGNNSMFTCSASSWTAITNTKSTALTTGVGYRIFVRGDRTIDLYATPDATPNNTTLRATGTLATGDFSTGTLPTGYALVGNPYASEIDWNASGWNTIRSNANISNAIYIYRPGIASAASANANQYAAYVGGTGTNGGVQYIASGQAFFVQVTSGTPVLSFTEAYKTSTGVAGQFKKASLVNHLRIGYAKDNEHVDEIVVRFMPDAKMVFDHNYDANSLNSEVFGLYSIKDTNHLAIQGRPDFVKEDAVKLSVNADVTGNFSLKFSETETFDKDIEIGLKDKFLGKTFAVEGNSSYPFEITTDSKSKGSNRFELVFTRMANGVKTNMEEISAFSLYPNPANKEVSISLNRKLEGVCSYVILNELGQEQMTGSLEFGAKGAQTIQVDQLSTGVYFVQLQMNNATQTIKFIK